MGFCFKGNINNHYNNDDNNKSTIKSRLINQLEHKNSTSSLQLIIGKRCRKGR